MLAAGSGLDIATRAVTTLGRPEVLVAESCTISEEATVGNMNSDDSDVVCPC